MDFPCPGRVYRQTSGSPPNADRAAPDSNSLHQDGSSGLQLFDDGSSSSFGSGSGPSEGGSVVSVDSNYRPVQTRHDDIFPDFVVVHVSSGLVGDRPF